jgi:hypothetical protein
MRFLDGRKEKRNGEKIRLQQSEQCRVAALATRAALWGRKGFVRVSGVFWGRIKSQHLPVDSRSSLA